jgi:hypothetical protein
MRCCGFHPPSGFLNAILQSDFVCFKFIIGRPIRNGAITADELDTVMRSLGHTLGGPEIKVRMTPSWPRSWTGFSLL